MRHTFASFCGSATLWAVGAQLSTAQDRLIAAVGSVGLFMCGLGSVLGQLRAWLRPAQSGQSDRRPLE